MLWKFLTINTSPDRSKQPQFLFFNNWVKEKDQVDLFPCVPCKHRMYNIWFLFLINFPDIIPENWGAKNQQDSQCRWSIFIKHVSSRFVLTERPPSKINIYIKLFTLSKRKCWLTRGKHTSDVTMQNVCFLEKSWWNTFMLTHIFLLQLAHKGKQLFEIGPWWWLYKNWLLRRKDLQRVTNSYSSNVKCVLLKWAFFYLSAEHRGWYTRMHCKDCTST